MLRTRQSRMIAYVGADTHVRGQGYRVSFVKEGEAGHFPTGTWPYNGTAGETMPWFWGPSLADAEAAMVEYNRRVGVEPEEAIRIVRESMARQRRLRRGQQRGSTQSSKGRARWRTASFTVSMGVVQ
jgi:hypothetical protein